MSIRDDAPEPRNPDEEIGMLRLMVDLGLLGFRAPLAIEKPLEAKKHTPRRARLRKRTTR